MKVGRVFRGTGVEGSAARGRIDNSKYVAHRGHYREFAAKSALKLLQPTAANNHGVIEGIEPIPWDKLWDVIVRHIQRLQQQKALKW